MPSIIRFILIELGMNYNVTPSGLVGRMYFVAIIISALRAL